MVVLEDHAVIVRTPSGVCLGGRARRSAKAISLHNNARTVAYVVATSISTARISGIDVIVLDSHAGGRVFDADAGIGDVAYGKVLHVNIIVPVQDDSVGARLL